MKFVHYLSWSCWLRISDIMQQQDTHHSIRCFLVHHFQRFEKVETTIRSSKLGIVNNWLGSSRRSDIWAYRVSIGPRDDCAPMLQAFSQRIVWTLGRYNPIDEEELILIIRYNWLQLVFHQTISKSDHVEERLPNGNITGIYTHGDVGFLEEKLTKYD